MLGLPVLLGPGFRGPFALKLVVDIIEVLNAEVVQRLLRRPIESEIPAPGEEDHLVAQQHVPCGMRDQQHRMALTGELAQEIHHPALAARVKARRDLIEEEEARLGEQLGAERDTSLLAAAEFADHPVPALRKVQYLQHFRYAPFALLRGRVSGQPQSGRVVQRLMDGQLHVNDVLLRNIPQLRAVNMEVGVEVVAVDQDLAVSSRPEAAQGIEQRGLAGAAGTDDRDKLAGLNGE